MGLFSGRPRSGGSWRFASPFGSSRSGAEVLAAWLARRAALAPRVVAPEEALLSGRFGRYAVRRLTALVLGRAMGTALHVLELTWLAAIFSARPFVASLALQNLTLVLDAAYWGCLEALRRRLRTLGPSSEAAALTTRWLTTALWVGLAVALVPVGQALAESVRSGVPPSMLHVYAIACAMRFGADVVLRTYYSGIFAFRRVHRPLWSVFVGPIALVGMTLALYQRVGGWSFPLALVASAALSRAFFYRFTRRAYRLHRVPPPRWTARLRLPPERGRGLKLGSCFGRFDMATIRDAALGGAANLTTRLGGVVLLAAAVPSLSTVTDDDDIPILEPFALALHLAAPLLLMTSQWSTVFYHDWKRVEEYEAVALARVLHARLLRTAVAVGLVSWAIACLLVLAYVRWDEAWTTLVALLPAMLGLSIWTELQLRGFAHGEFGKQVASASAMLLVLWLTLSTSLSFATDSAVATPATASATATPSSPVPIAWYVALAAGPWVAIVLQALVSSGRVPRARGEVPTVAAWVRALAAEADEVVVWSARAAQRAPRVATRIAAELGSRGAVVRVGRHLWWFERTPQVARDVWLQVGAGTLDQLRQAGRGTGHLVVSELVARGDFGAIEEPPERSLGPYAVTVPAALRDAFVTAFGEGFVLEVGRPPPARFLALAPELRQALWRDGLRLQRGGRARSGWFVTAYAPDGVLGALFVAPRPVDPDDARVWRERVKVFERLGLLGLPPRPRRWPSARA